MNLIPVDPTEALRRLVAAVDALPDGRASGDREASEKLAEALAEARTVAQLKPGAVRVVRLLEYVYPDAKDALKDMQNWAVQGVYRPSAGRLIRSTVLPMEVLD